MRETYSLSEETRLTLTGAVGDFANETHKTDKYFYAILAGTETDIFAKFEKLYYAPAARLGLTCHWRNRLNAIDARYAQFPSAKLTADCVREKIAAHAKFLEKYIEAVADGTLDVYEIRELESRLDELDRISQHLRVSLSFQRGMLECSNGKKAARANNYNGRH